VLLLMPLDSSLLQGLRVIIRLLCAVSCGMLVDPVGLCGVLQDMGHRVQDAINLILGGMQQLSYEFLALHPLELRLTSLGLLSVR